MNTTAPSTQEYFSAADVARAVGLKGEAGKKMIKRTAALEQWPSKMLGNKLVFVPPATIAELIVAPPAEPNAESTAPVVRFSDLTHSDAARATVLLRKAAVDLVTANAALGKEVALKLAVHRMRIAHPLFRVGVSSLRQWCDKFAAGGIDGLVEQKKGVVGRKSYASQVEEHHLLAAAANSVERGIKGRLNVARGYREALLNNPTVNGPVRAWLHGEHASKAYVPKSIRTAIQDRANPLTTKLVQIGPRAAKLAGPYTECSYDDLRAGQAFTADDMTANCYVWCEWPNEQGFLLIRPQILAAMDVGSMYWLNIRAIIRPNGQYTKDDVWGLVGDVFDDYGLFDTAIFEGGTWQSNVVKGHATDLDDSTRFGGLQSLGVKLIHSRTPQGKIIETAFNSLQHAADNVRGFCGRMEMKDCPEEVRKQLYQVKHGHAHPRQYFLHINEYTNHIKGVMNALNNERGDGKILKGRAPVEKWAEDAPELRVMPDDAKWMYRADYRVTKVTRNGVRVLVGSGKYQSAYTYINPEKLDNHRGRRVVVYWNDYDPDTDAVVYTISNGKPDKFLCVASRLHDSPRLGASQDQHASEAARKKLSMQHSRTQRASLAPYLQRRERVITSPATEVGQRIDAAKAENESRQQSKRNVRQFVGSPEILLDAQNLRPVDAPAPAEAAPIIEGQANTRCDESLVQESLQQEGGKFIYKLKPSPAVSDKGEYVDYLVKRLTDFRKAGASFGQAYHAKVTVAVTRKIAEGQLKCSLQDETRFDEICDHLKSKIDATILGKRNAAKGTPNYHAFEPVHAEVLEFNDLGAETLLG